MKKQKKGRKQTKNKKLLPNVVEKRKRCVNHVDHPLMEKINKNVNGYIKENNDAIESRENVINDRYKKNNAILKPKQSKNLNILKTETDNVTIPIVFYVKCPNQSYLPKTGKCVTDNDIKKFVSDLNNNYSANISNHKMPDFKDSPDTAKVYKSYIALKTKVNVSFVVKEIKYFPSLVINDKDMSTDDMDDLIKKSSNIYDVPDEDAGRVLNIWMITFTDVLLGYAQFPWELEEKKYTDGVVIDYKTISPKFGGTKYNMNKTAVHEVGHWLGLYHTFQCDPIDNNGKMEGVFDTNMSNIVDDGEKTGDCVSDTPYQAEANYDNPYDHPVSKWPKDGDTLNMFMNYMDYCDDDALFMFTKEQADKIMIMIKFYRPNLIN